MAHAGEEAAPALSAVAVAESEPTAKEGELQASAATATDKAADDFVAGATDVPLLDPGAQALAMDTTPPSSPQVETYEPITMADAPPLAPMDHDAAKIPAEPPMLTGMANRVDVFVAQRATRATPPAVRPFPVPSYPVLVATLAAIAVGLLIWRASVVLAMPQMASLYATIGLPVNVRGLVFEDVSTAQETQDGVQVLVVEGAVANVVRSAVDVPRLRFAVLNANGAEVYAWTSLPSRSVLASGEKLPFRTRLASPPADGREVTVRFYNRRDATGGSH
jgi:hypothetical protein